jgi:hypothetical protein
MRTIVSTLLLAPLALSAVAASADCQLMASEPATVSQTVDGTRVTVTYYRPRARGRTGLFGSTIKWGETWTPGANASTRLEVSKDVTIEGQRVPKGTYSVWIAVARDTWEMLLDRDTALFHTQAPKHRAGQVRFNVSREKKPFMEALTWWIPEMSPTGMTLAMQWDTVYVPLRIKVPPSYTRTTDTEVARRIVGKYRLRLEPMPELPKDTTLHEPPGDKPPAEVTFTIRHDGGELRAVMDPPMYSSEPGYSDWMLLPRGAGMFRLGRLQQGELVEVMDFLTVEFDSGGDRAAGFEVRLPNDNIVGKATRVP